MRKSISLDEKIELQKQMVAKTKARYEASLLKLEKLLKERDAKRNKELLKAISNSNHSYEEIIAFLQDGSSDEENFIES